jgi:hypothetical protein
METARWSPFQHRKHQGNETFRPGFHPSDSPLPWEPWEGTRFADKMLLVALVLCAGAALITAQSCAPATGQPCMLILAPVMYATNDTAPSKAVRFHAGGACARVHPEPGGCSGRSSYVITRTLPTQAALAVAGQLRIESALWSTISDPSCRLALARLRCAMTHVSCAQYQVTTAATRDSLCYDIIGVRRARKLIGKRDNPCIPAGHRFAHAPALRVGV